MWVEMLACSHRREELEELKLHSLRFLCEIGGRLLLRQKRAVERGFEKSGEDLEGLQSSGKR